MGAGCHFLLQEIFLTQGSNPSLLLMQETQVLSLGWEDPLEEEMVTHLSILAGKSHGQEEPGGLQFMG